MGEIEVICYMTKSNTDMNCIYFPTLHLLSHCQFNVDITLITRYINEVLVPHYTDHSLMRQLHVKILRPLLGSQKSTVKMLVC